MPKSPSPQPRFASVSPPALIGPRGALYHLDNKPVLEPGCAHVILRRRRTPPLPLFPASPPTEWHPAHEIQRSRLWGRAAEAARHAVSEVVQGTARALNIAIVEDDDDRTGEDVYKLYGIAIARRPPLNAIHVHEIGFVTSNILAAARHYDEWSLAWAEDLVVPRKASEPIVVAWQNYDARTTERLRSLLRAAEGGTRARLELKWYQTPPAARHLVDRAAMALPRAERQAVSARALVPGDMISAPMPSREFLRMALPEAIKLSARQRGRSVSDADAFLGVVREMFLRIVGDGNDRLRVGRYEVPNGDGADFVRKIEAIFDVRLLDESSRHAIRRVRKLRLPTPKAHGPYLRKSLRIVRRSLP